MLQDKKLFITMKFNLQAIPVCLAALVLWAIIGGWYVAVAPRNMAGADNIGIVLSIFGICLFSADRFALFWFDAYSKIVIFPTWIWGMIFIAWGLVEWLHAFSRRYTVFFLIHWSILLIAAALIQILIGHRRQKTE